MLKTDIYYTQKTPNILNYNIDGSPFGVTLKDREFTSEKYRYGMNGQEREDEITNSPGSHYSAEYWMYDTRLGRRWNLDPVDQINLSNYSTFANNPILYKDPKGDKPGDYVAKDGTHLGTDGIDDQQIYQVNVNVSGGDTYSQEELLALRDESAAGTHDLVTNISAETGITRDEFFHMAGLAYKEEPAISGKYAVAYAQKNRWDSRGGTFTETFNTFGGSVSEDLHTQMMETREPYRNFINASISARNENDHMRFAMAGALNALNGGYDYSNGATGWQGTDIMGGVSGSRADEYMAEEGYMWSDDAIYNAGNRFTPTTYPNTPNSSGEYGLLIKASYGGEGPWSGTILTIPNPDK